LERIYQVYGNICFFHQANRELFTAGPFYDKLKDNPNATANAERLTKTADEIDSQFDGAAPKDAVLNGSAESGALPSAAAKRANSSIAADCRKQSQTAV
jgi:hypothetical protein